MIVYITFLALCGIATANLNANCNDAAAVQFAAGLTGCDPDNGTTYCTPECAGAYCQFLTNNSYTEDCIISMAFNCLEQVQSVPENCDRCLDGPALSIIPTLPASCGFSDGSGNDMKYCVDDCFGLSCQFYSNNSYPSSCRGGLEQICMKSGFPVPSACAVAQPTPTPTPNLEPTPTPTPPTRNFDCFDQAQMQYSMAFLAGCNMSDSVNFCNSQCGGALCTYYTDNNYATTCNLEIAGQCFFDTGTFPSTCNTCFSTGVVQNFLTLSATCDYLGDNPNPQVLCTDECDGALCMYYEDNGFNVSCRTDIGLSCKLSGATVPTRCSGAAAMKTILSLFAMILLVSFSLVF